MAEDANVNELQSRIQHAWSEIVKMEERITTLVTEETIHAQRLAELTTAIKSDEDLLTRINNHYADYFGKSDPTAKSKMEIVLEHHSLISEFEKTVAAASEELNGFKEYVDGNLANKKDGIKKQLELALSNNNKLLKELEDQWSETYSTLYDKIEGLLPGATATGLSKAYQDQNNKYKVPVFIWSLVFTLTVAGMMVFAIVYYDESQDFYDTVRHYWRDCLFLYQRFGWRSLRQDSKVSTKGYNKNMCTRRLFQSHMRHTSGKLINCPRAMKKMSYCRS